MGKGYVITEQGPVIGDSEWNSGRRSFFAKFIMVALVFAAGVGIFHGYRLLTQMHTLTIHYGHGLTVQYEVRHGRLIDINIGNSLRHPIQGLSWDNGQEVTLGDLAAGMHISDWYLDEGFLVPFDVRNRITGDMTLHAEWVANKYTIRVFDTLNGREETVQLPFGQVFTLGELFPDFLMGESLGFSTQFRGFDNIVPLERSLTVTQNMVYYAVYAVDHFLHTEVLEPPFKAQHDYLYSWENEEWVRVYFPPEDILVRFVINEDAIITAEARERFNNFETFSHNTIDFLDLKSIEGVTPISTGSGFQVFSHWALQRYVANRVPMICDVSIWDSGHFVDIGLLAAGSSMMEGPDLYRVENDVKIFTFVAVWKQA